MGVTDKEAVEAARTLKKYCKKNGCDHCILKRDGICMAKGWPCPAFWKVRDK